jgi:uroporphyrin-III C-methyltransferase/precorrin-2 dehydrogenase/sirohydrochlorin ferrochelatase
MDYLPIFMDLRGRRALVVGGGEVAARRVALLRRAGASVTIVAPQVGAAVRRQLADDSVACFAGPFAPEHLRGCALAVAATNSQAVNRSVARHARLSGIPVNVVDDPSLCTFIMPAIIDRSPVVIAVSTGGASPVLARMLRAQLEALIPAAYGRLAELAAKWRPRVRQLLPDAGGRRRFWEEILEGRLPERVFANDADGAEATLRAALSDAVASSTAPRGEVWLIGAGPGDPELLTLRALRLMQQADVVVHDRLVSDAVLDLARREAPRIYAGKVRAAHSMAQDEINDLLVRLAREGKRVARLKGGDPFVFGRGGEEIQALAAAGIPFSVVPGVSAATGCAAYAGIPLTHRDYSQQCVFITGGQKDGRLDLDWAGLARPRQTIVIYMGLKNLPTITAKLIAHGLASTTPAAIIENATRTDQRVIVGTASTIAALAAEASITGPATALIGEVVAVRDQVSRETPDDLSAPPLVSHQQALGDAAPGGSAA